MQELLPLCIKTHFLYLWMEVDWLSVCLLSIKSLLKYCQGCRLSLLFLVVVVRTPQLHSRGLVICSYHAFTGATGPYE